MVFLNGRTSVDISFTDDRHLINLRATKRQRIDVGILSDGNGLLSLPSEVFSIILEYLKIHKGTIKSFFKVSKTIRGKFNRCFLEQLVFSEMKLFETRFSIKPIKKTEFYERQFFDFKESDILNLYNVDDIQSNHRIYKNVRSFRFGIAFGSYRTLDFSSLRKLSPSIKELIFPDPFNVNFGDAFENSCVEILKFSESYNKPLEQLPKTLKTITFGTKFNQTINDLPPSIEKLTFGDTYCQRGENFPLSLKILIFGRYYGINEINRDTDDEYTTKKFTEEPYVFKFNLHELIYLTYLKFGEYFNQSIGKLPPNLETLIFGEYFDQPFNHQSHRCLRTLHFGRKFNQSLSEMPCGLRYLTLECTGSNYSLGYLPDTLIYLKTNSGSFDFAREKSMEARLPSMLRYLEILNSTLFYSLHKIQFPPSLKNIHVRVGDMEDNYKLFSLYENIESNSFTNSSVTDLHIIASYTYTQLMKSWMPKGLLSLTLDGCFNSVIGNNVLPNGLQVLRLGRHFDHHLYSLPVDLKTLLFPSDGLFNRPILKYPPSLHTLELPNKYNQSLGNLPSTLRHLKVGEAFEHRIPDDILSNLEHLEIDQEYSYVLKAISANCKVVLRCYDRYYPRSLLHITEQRNIWLSYNK